MQTACVVIILVAIVCMVIACIIAQRESDKAFHEILDVVKEQDNQIIQLTKDMRLAEAAIHHLNERTKK
ncbi:hypothetical protein [Bifidobacterium cuniculi]|uniref:Uncharacterized protein n=1 Tax=Bifidobacterium cuniculi TaxID=1688 RepID=A0A087B4Z8_9BIFI|nr:hypothetical protein [Bifidobacterium cuniculi]KFI66098.1 hypothetical protein BCUN_0600 [Bifidobacterium cuniculi]